MAVSQFILQAILQFKNQSAAGQKQATSGLDKLKKAATVAASAFAALKSAQVAVDFVKMGASALRAGASLDALAKSAGTSGDAIVSAIQSSSDFTIDRMTAMSAANKALVLNVAKTPEAFSRLTKVATALGRAMGQDAAKSIDDFVVAAGRQSRMIADNLGLMVSAEDANKRYAEANNIVGRALTDTEKKQSFLNEMLRQGEIKMAEMGEQTLDAAGQIEQFTAAASDMKTGLAEMAAEAVFGGEGMSQFNRQLANVPTALQQILTIGGGVVAFLKEFTILGTAGIGPMDAFRASVQEAMWANQEFSEESAPAIDFLDLFTEANLGAAPAIAATKVELGLLATGSAMMEAEVRRLTEADKANTRQMQDWRDATEEAKEAQERLTAARNASLSFGAAFTTFQQGMTEDTASATEAREALEAEHAANLEELTARSQATMIQINAAAEEEKLQTLKDKLAMALLQQSEFGAKVKESTRIAKENQIAQLEEEIAGKETLLGNYYGGRLIKQGENVTALLSQEEIRYTEELRMLEENRVAQEAEQKRSLGAMLLQHFEAWAKMKGLTEEQMYDMRLKISEEYGIITSEGARAAKDAAWAWESEFFGPGAMNWDDLEAKRARYYANVQAMVGKTIRITTEYAQIGSGPRLAAASGTDSSPGGMTLVGERGPELVNMPRGAQVFTAPETRRMLAETGEGMARLGQTANRLTLPDWLTPGSPTPLEKALVGITERAKDLSQTELPKLKKGLNITANQAGWDSMQKVVYQLGDESVPKLVDQIDKTNMGMMGMKESGDALFPVLIDGIDKSDLGMMSLGESGEVVFPILVDGFGMVDMAVLQVTDSIRNLSQVEIPRLVTAWEEMNRLVIPALPGGGSPGISMPTPRPPTNTITWPGGPTPTQPPPLGPALPGGGLGPPPLGGALPGGGVLPPARNQVGGVAQMTTINVNITEPIAVRDNRDIDRIANAIARRVVLRGGVREMHRVGP